MIFIYTFKRIRFLILFSLCALFLNSYSQTIIISPSADGGFEAGATFALNNWTATTGGSTQNQWVCNTGATTGFSGIRCAYITNNTSGIPPHTYTLTTSRTSHFYRNITIPAGESNINLSFSWIGIGESTYDKLRIWAVPTTYNPVYGTTITTTGTAPTGRIQIGGNFSSQNNWTNTTLSLPSSYAGTTFRLIFEWTNDASLGTNPPIAIDNISLISQILVPPSNSTCSTATNLPCGTTNLAGTTVNTSNINNGTGCSMGDYGVWYSFVGDGYLTTISSTANFDHEMAIISGNCGSLTNISCNDSALSGGTESYSFSSAIGVTYYVYISHWLSGSTTTGTFTITRSCATCSVPTLNNTTNVTTTSATINWNAATPAPSNGYQYIVSTSNTTPVVAGTPTTLTNANISSLTPNSTYYIFVRSDCGSGDFSSWTPYGIFYTGYCSSTSTNSSYYINNFSTSGGFNNISNNNSGYSSAGYGNFTAQTVSQINSASVSFSASFYDGTYTYGFNIWVDWNDDFDFLDAGELVYASGSYVSNASGTITVPASASIGNHRMRIVANYFSTNPNYCGSISYGETEDYTFTVLNPLPCVANPSNIFVSATSQTTAVVNWTAPNPVPANGYQYFLSSSNNTPSPSATPTGSIGGGITSLNLTGLSSNGNYYIWIRSDCGGALGQGSWIGPIYFHQPNCNLGSGLGTSSLGCPIVDSGGLGLNGVDPPSINTCGSSTCVDLEASYLHLGQTTSYTVQSIPYNPPYQFNCLRNPVSVNIDDVWSQPINLPFNFCFYGNTYNQCLISSNGVITFNMTNNTPGGYSAWSFSNNIPSNSLFLNSIFGVYHDIDPSIGGEVGWELVTLSSGCRALVASWKDIPMYSSTCNSQLYTGMIVLYENTNIIEIYIKEKNVCASWNAGNAIVGIQNNTGTIGTVAPNRNGLDPDWTVSNEAWRFSPSGASITSIKWYEGLGTSGLIVGNTDVINVCPSETTTYTAEVTYTKCNGTTFKQSDSTTVTILANKTWNGSVSTDWDTSNNWTPIGIPNNSDCVIIPFTTNDPIISGTNYNGLAGNLTVKNGATLTINSNNSISVTDWVKVETTGTFIIKNNSSLIQINNSTNIGNIIYERNATIRRSDYVYWSSPVANLIVNTIANPLSFGYIYKWNTTVSNPNGGQGNWESASGNSMIPGKGYIASGPNSFSTSIPTLLNGKFIGVPNNGVINFPISRGNDINTSYHTGVNGIEITNFSDNWNLVGNPYPSAIRGSQFLYDNNTKIEGNIKLWTHGTLPAAVSSPFYDSFVYNYSPGDYLTYNFTGTSCCPAAGADLFIGSGQGFFVQMQDGPASSDFVTFNNNLRNATYANNVFYRLSNSTLNNIINLERNRIWLDIIGVNGISDRTLFGYIQNATMGKDNFFDCAIQYTGELQVYSLIDNTKYTIQGRSLPFDINDEVPIGLNIPTTGNYSIAIGAVDGLFDTQNIYLKDNLLNIIFDIKSSPYQFTSQAGAINDRFQIVYLDSSLGTNDLSLDNIIKVFTNNEIEVSSSNLQMDSIEVFNVLGQQINTFKNINSNHFTLNNLRKNNTTLLLKIKLLNGEIVIKKIIY